MASFEVKITKNNIKAYSRKAQKVYRQALDDCIDDLVRTSSQSAPHDKGILEKSWSKDVKFRGMKPHGIVSYSVKNKGKNGNFNYALKMHEGGYNLGEGSLAKAGGTGMSGKTYNVGAGYLGDVAKGEKHAYTKHIEKNLKQFSRKF